MKNFKKERMAHFECRDVLLTYKGEMDRDEEIFSE